MAKKTYTQVKSAALTAVHNYSFAIADQRYAETQMCKFVNK